MPISSTFTARRAASTVTACVPFAFGAVRALQTGTDFRYLAMALAELAGAALALAVTRSRSTTIAAVAAGLVATVSGVLLAVARGTRLGPGLLIVASGFGLCMAVAAALAHHSSRECGAIGILFPHTASFIDRRYHGNRAVTRRVLTYAVCPAARPTVNCGSIPITR